MIIVDTSVWVATLRDASDPAAPRLRALLDADDVALPLPVRVELLAGVARPHRAALKRALSALPVLIPSEETWRILERWIEPAAEQGQRFGVGDLLIAALADEFGGMIWSLDADFDRLERLGFARLL